MKHLKISSIELVPDKFGQHIQIKRIGLYDSDGKWIKWVKLTPEIVASLGAKRFTLTEEQALSFEA